MPHNYAYFLCVVRAPERWFYVGSCGCCIVCDQPEYVGVGHLIKDSIMVIMQIIMICTVFSNLLLL